MSSGKTRRELLITAGSGVALGLLSPMLGLLAQGPGTATPRTRKNVTSSAAQNDLASLKKGVAAMKKLIQTDPKDPRGWILQSFIHGDCDGFTDCQHGSWYFAPWHRSFIYFFEQLIQFYSGDNNFALPYWDWSRTHSVPGSFYGTGNPLNDDLSISSLCPGAPTAGRGRSASAQFSQSDLDNYVGTAVINGIQQDPDYATWGGDDSSAGEIEITPHNFIHRWVGGAKQSNMVQTFSPMDPIFWMHHCNIDRLYSNWLSRPGHTPPQESEWQSQSFNDFYDTNGNQTGSQFTCGQTVDSKVMGYVYDSALEIPEPLAARAKTRLKAQVVGSLAASTAAVKAGVLSFVTDAAPPMQIRHQMAAAAAGASDYTVRLRISGVKPPKRQNTAVHVFLGPNVTPQTPTTAPGYVGSFTFFNGHTHAHANANAAAGGRHHHAGARNMILNASKALERLYGDISLPEGANLSVSLVTRALYQGVDAFATVEDVKPDKIQFDVVNLVPA